MNKPTKEQIGYRFELFTCRCEGEDGQNCFKCKLEEDCEKIKQAIRRIIEQSKPIPREFVERWVSQIIFLPLNAMEHWSVCLPDQLRDMLRELGHEVEEKEGGGE